MSKQVDLDLQGADGNAFALIGKFADQARQEGWQENEINEVITEAKSGDYDQLLQTLLKYTS